MTRPAPPTLDDVARRAGVSTATISRALNTPEKVAKRTRKTIEDAITELGYTPNFGGQVLASNRTRTIGAVIPTLANSMFAAGLQAFQERLALDQMTLIVASSGYDPMQELVQVRSLLARGADGLMLVGTERAEETRRFLRMRRVPHVLTWCFEPDNPAPCAGFSSFEGAAALTRAVLDLGHRRIAVIAARTAGNDRARGRLAGVVETASQTNATILCCVETDYGADEGRAAFDTVMAHDPTVVICANDVLAAGAMSRARERGIDVPGQVSITGFDDTEIATLVHPALTTVRVPHQAMGRAAAEILLDEIAGESHVRSLDLGTEVVIRQSLGPPPSS